MKHFILFVLFASLLTGCVGWYDKMSHLDENDLEWVNWCNEGDSMFYFSNKGAQDTMIITNKFIDDTHNPFFIHFIDNYPGPYHDSGAGYAFKNNVFSGIFMLQKLAKQGEVIYEASLDKRFYSHPMFLLGSESSEDYLEQDTANIKPIRFVMNGQKFDNCFIFDESNSHLSINNDQENPIESFVISKDYGLIYYRFADGEEFFRKFE